MPELSPAQCGEFVCLTVEDTVKLVEWANGMDEVERAVKACSLVTRG